MVGKRFGRHKIDMYKFKFDVDTLIKSIEERPCLWDKTLDCFKDRLERENAWREICVRLQPDYNEKDRKEQKKIAYIINNKWQNVRDSFVKSLKKQTLLQSATKKYIFHDQLQFLMKVIQRDDFPITPDQQQVAYYQIEEIQPVKMELETPVLEVIADGDTMANIDDPLTQDMAEDRYVKRRKLRRKQRISTQIDRAIMRHLRTITTRTIRKEEEDEAFFLSISQSVSSMTEEQKIDFRMGVLQLIKDIKCKASS